jgi:hypothetical protein
MASLMGSMLPRIAVLLPRSAWLRGTIRRCFSEESAAERNPSLGVALCQQMRSFWEEGNMDQLRWMQESGTSLLHASTELQSDLIRFHHLSACIKAGNGQLKLGETDWKKACTINGNINGDSTSATIALLSDLAISEDDNDNDRGDLFDIVAHSHRSSSLLLLEENQLSAKQYLANSQLLCNSSAEPRLHIMYLQQEVDAFVLQPPGGLEDQDQRWDQMREYWERGLAYEIHGESVNVKVIHSHVMANIGMHLLRWGQRLQGAKRVTAREYLDNAWSGLFTSHVNQAFTTTSHLAAHLFGIYGCWRQSESQLLSVTDPGTLLVIEGMLRAAMERMEESGAVNCEIEVLQGYIPYLQRMPALQSRLQKMEVRLTYLKENLRKREGPNVNADGNNGMNGERESLFLLDGMVLL